MLEVAVYHWQGVQALHVQSEYDFWEDRWVENYSESSCSQIKRSLVTPSAENKVLLKNNIFFGGVTV